MDKQKRLILAVAGSGKTSYIINSLNLEERTAIITYTVANQAHLKSEIVKKFGYIPDNIHLFGFWQFTYNFCLVPFYSVKPKGIIFDNQIQKENNPYNRKQKYGIKGFVFSNMLCKLLLDYSLPYITRINKFFDTIYVDEVQDFDSYDLDWLFSLSKTSINICLVGDYFQKTFSTSHSGNKGKAYTKDYSSYINGFEKNNYVSDTKMLSQSFRCSPEICEFISTNVGIEIQSARDIGNNTIELVEDINEIEAVMKNDGIKKLFYQKHTKYACSSGNWGDSKGLSFLNVCVVLNKSTMQKYKKKQLELLAEKTKSKFYVACTRSLGNLYFIDEAKIPKEFILSL